MKTIINNPISRTIITDVEVSRIDLQQKLRPRLSAQWVIGSDGKLICRWDLV